MTASGDRPADMKRDWDERARENAAFYIATSAAAGETAFVASGKSDTALFFDGLGHLLTERTRVVDIGCGIGRMDEHIAPRVAELTGVDVSGEMVARARQRLAHLPNVQFVEGDGRSLPLADASADLVFSYIVLQHVPRSVAAGYFAEAFRVLVSGGHFVFQMPGAGEHTPDDPPEQDSIGMRFWTPGDIEDGLRGRGFEWLACRRFAAGDEVLRFDQLRVLARKP